jgi:hypothetical protein
MWPKNLHPEAGREVLGLARTGSPASLLSAFFCACCSSQKSSRKAQWSASRLGLRASSGGDTGRRGGERFLRAGVVIPHPGAPTEAPATTSRMCDTPSLNGFPEPTSDVSDVGQSKVGKSGKPDFASGEARKRGRDSKNAAEERRKACALRHWARDAASWRPNVPRHGTLRCGDPHQRRSALRPLIGGNKNSFKPRRRKPRVMSEALAVWHREDGSERRRLAAPFGCARRAPSGRALTRKRKREEPIDRDERVAPPTRPRARARRHPPHKGEG